MSSVLSVSRPDDLRRRNLSVLLTHLHRDGTQTRAELTQRLGLNRSTVLTLVSQLSLLGLADETVPTGGIGVGRPSFVVGPRHLGPYVLAVDIDVHQLAMAAVGLGGTVLQRWSCDYPPGPIVARHVIGSIGEGHRAIRARLARSGWLAGVGVSVPGTVRRSDGRILRAPNLDWRDVSLDRLIASEIGWSGPVRMANDADLGALAEHLRGAARGVEDVLFIGGRVGIGGGVISNGVPLHGAGGLAGEIGHVSLDPSGPLCHCGNHGCLETYVGEVAFIRLSGRSAIVGGSVVGGVVAAAAAGDERAHWTIRAVSTSLGRGLANIASVLDPAIIVVGGSLAQLFDAQADLIRSAFDETGGVVPRQSVDIRPGGLGDDASLLGAAEIAFAALLDDPVAITGALAVS